MDSTLWSPRATIQLRAGENVHVVNIVYDSSKGYPPEKCIENLASTYRRVNGGPALDASSLPIVGESFEKLLFLWIENIYSNDYENINVECGDKPPEEIKIRYVPHGATAQRRTKSSHIYSEAKSWGLGEFDNEDDDKEIYKNAGGYETHHHLDLRFSARSVNGSWDALRCVRLSKGYELNLGNLRKCEMAHLSETYHRRNIHASMKTRDMDPLAEGEARHVELAPKLKLVLDKLQKEMNRDADPQAGVGGDLPERVIRG